MVASMQLLFTKEGVIVDLKEKVAALPSVPGVYLMKDSLGSIIYVGKSKNLKSRVGSYFQNSNSRSPKVEKLIKNLKDFEYITTDTEFEAFMLECKLIKEIKPRYNKLMKNSLSYTYITIKLAEKHPGIEISSTISHKESELYFGPYTSSNTVEKALQGIKEFYKIICNNQNRHGTACLNYSLGLCIGICLDNPEATAQYNSIINKITSLLDGTDTSILREMEEKMLVASSEFDFEAAARYRDRIDAVTYLINSRKSIEFSQKNKNIVMFESINENLTKLFLISRNKILFSETYNTNEVSPDQLNQLAKIKAAEYFKADTSDSNKELTRDEIDEAQIIYGYLKSKNGCHITYNLFEDLY
jgi:excinuclease ABC subunit C